MVEERPALFENRLPFCLIDREVAALARIMPLMLTDFSLGAFGGDDALRVRLQVGGFNLA